MTNHEFHRLIGTVIRKNLSEYRHFMDVACLDEAAQSARQNVPLFCSIPKCSSVEYCDVDVAILKDSRLRVVIEIEESAINPIKICGKVLATALTRYHVHEGEDRDAFEMGDEVLFVQILRVTPKTTQSRKDQWDNLAECILLQLPLGSITDYHLCYGTNRDFAGRKGRCLVDTIRHFLDNA